MALTSPPTAPTMSIKELAELTGDSHQHRLQEGQRRHLPQHQTWRERQDRGVDRPTLAILAGQSPAGGSLPPPKKKRAPPAAEVAALKEAGEVQAGAVEACGEEGRGGAAGAGMTRRPPLSARELRERSLARRNVGLREAALYIDVSPRLFTTLVKQGRLPAPR